MQGVRAALSDAGFQVVQEALAAELMFAARECLQGRGCEQTFTDPTNRVAWEDARRPFLT